MLLTNRPAGRCVYCAFRSQQRALQARRLRSSAAAAPSHANSEGPTFHYQQSISREARGARGSSRDSQYDESFGKNGLVRRLGGRGNDAPSGEGRRKRQDQSYNSFNDALHKRMTALKHELSEAPLLEHIWKEAEKQGEKADNFRKIWYSFEKLVLTEQDAVFQPRQKGDLGRKLRLELREAYHMRGNNGLDDRIKYAFYGHVTGARFTDSDIRNQRALADLRYPTEWFPGTRSMHRTVHLHVGPTNSGKTYHALQRLEKADRGVYAGPLRLLAHEVYTRMNAKGIACSLVTGEERRVAEEKEGGPHHMAACTVEMMPLNRTLDVAVIDEIQMIGNADRGWAWTQALLGVKAKEVHLCGEERTVPLIRELCASVGDKFEIHRYERLSPLEVAEGSLDGDLKKLRKGDCIVSFSVMGIHALRKQIEKQTGRKVATVYGSLPPETRAQQARLFNDPHNDYDYLVASDAVGMGLNLAIKRIIFEAASKFDGVQRRTLGIADIKQIAGRAGRYRTAEQAAQTPAETQVLAAAKGDSPVKAHGEGEKESVGLVTTIEPFDFPIVAAAMAAEPEPIRTAGLFPPSSVLERFASYFPPGTPFSYILIRLHELSQTHSRFHLCGLKDQIWVADIIEPVKGLTVADRNTICAAPAGRSDEMWVKLMPAYARCIAEQKGGSIVDIEELPFEVLEAEVSASRDYLKALEQLHKAIVTYLWLSYRFAGIFSTRALAFHVKGMVEEKIETVLGKFSFSETQRRKVAAKREVRVLRDLEDAARRAAEQRAEAEAGEGEETGEPGKAVENVGDEVSQSSESREAGLSGAAEEAVIGEHNAHVEAQTSLTAGGDRFGGEEELELGLEDPADYEVVEENQSAARSFAQWRQKETRDESQRSKEEDDDSRRTISEAFSEGEEEAAAAAEEGRIEEPSEERPSIADARPEEAAASESGASTEIASPEQDVTDVEASFTPETELAGDERPAPVETQIVPPKGDATSHKD